MDLFFCYFGGKWQIAKHYPAPQHQVLIEPFAGAAGYSLRYPEKQVKLFDLDPAICGIWDYLIKSDSNEILALPIEFNSVDDLKIPQEARWLIGFWLNKGTSTPSKTPSRWMRDGARPNSFWGTAIRQRIAGQVGLIKHWTIEQKSFDEIDNQEATWFVDPPYHSSGKYYRHSKVDYVLLGEWCRGRSGQVIACEQEGADWLPFETFRTIRTLAEKNKGRCKEVVWIKEK